MKGEKRATMVFFGEGSTEEGVFAEALNFAALKKLPVIFVCENKKYSVYSSMSVRQPAGRSLTEMVRAHGVNASKGDGNDVEAVYRLCLDAVQGALNGDGPTFLEFETYRWLEHCGPSYDNNIGYRTEEEFLEWKKRCPLDNYRAALIRDGVIAEDEITGREESFRREIDEAFAFAKQSSFPEEEEFLGRVYAPGGGR
jgi:pyruvate dehydrogenase E1 component alpha subunit